ERRWIFFLGDFAILKEFFAQKKGFWHIGRLFDALLRGFGQTVFSNNPLSGLLIIATLAVIAPGTLALSAIAGVLGLLVSVLLQEPQDNVENGLSVLNPLLVGVVSCVMIPRFYGAFDAFSLLHLLVAVIISVYLARSLGSDKFSCTAWPFNLVEFALIFALSAQNGTGVVTRSVEPMFEMHNATSETTTTDDVGFYTRNATNIDWGMVLQGSVVSLSQLYGMENIVVGSVMYLAMLLYSPTTVAFSFLGALGGTLIGLELGADHNEVYSGFWGYNSLLTGAALGGNLLVLNAHTAAATILAIIYTALLQFSIKMIFINTQLPILTLPFVIAVSMFLKLSNGKEDPMFPWPVSISSPEKQRYDYLARRAAIREVCFIRFLMLSPSSSDVKFYIRNDRG
ncbi:Urea transporter, partial [Ooceraea biroi]